MIELGLLGLLSEQNLHGYELKKQLSELLGSWSLSFGSLYPALSRLERAELVKAVEANVLPEPSTPMTGALSGELAAFRAGAHRAPALGRLAPRGKGRAPGSGRRAKKVYGITDRGLDRLTDLLQAPGPDDDRTFSLRVAFCRHLPPAARLALFERRRAELVGLLAERAGRPRGERPRGGPVGPGSPPRRVDPYRRSLRERDNRALAHDLAWLDELIEAARADQAAGPGHHDPDTAAPSPSLSTLTTRPSDPPRASKEGSP
jgi:DNA-binding PadR family transcriptional regulator